ncbi:MAG: signal peptide peptidase SppA [Spirochaetota bacterium]
MRPNAFAVRGIIALSVIGLGLAAGVVTIALSPRSSPKESASTQPMAFTKPGVAIIDVNDILSLERGNSFFGETLASSAESIIGALDSYGDDPRVRAIVLSVNCPGGTPSACEEIYRKMMELKKDRKMKFVAYFKEVAASGAYYISMPADRIVTTSGCITGSVGVIMYTLNFSGLMERFGVKYQGYTSGRNKDMGSPYRKAREDETEYFNEMIRTVYADFRNVVMLSRGSKLRGDPSALLDGRIFSGAQAVRNGIADMIGTEHDAIAEACKLAGLDPSEPVIIEHRNDGNFMEQLKRAMGAVADKKIDVKTGIESVLPSKYSGVPLYLYSAGQR